MHETRVGHINIGERFPGLPRKDWQVPLFLPLTNFSNQKEYDSDDHRHTVYTADLSWAGKHAGQWWLKLIANNISQAEIDFAALEVYSSWRIEAMATECEQLPVCPPALLVYDAEKQHLFVASQHIETQFQPSDFYRLHQILQNGELPLKGEGFSALVQGRVALPGYIQDNTRRVIQLALAYIIFQEFDAKSAQLKLSTLSKLFHVFDGDWRFFKVICQLNAYYAGSYLACLESIARYCTTPVLQLAYVTAVDRVTSSMPAERRSQLREQLADLLPAIEIEDKYADLKFDWTDQRYTEAEIDQACIAWLNTFFPISARTWRSVLQVRETGVTPCNWLTDDVVGSNPVTHHPAMQSYTWGSLLQYLLQPDFFVKVALAALPFSAKAQALVQSFEIERATEVSKTVRADYGFVCWLRTNTRAVKQLILNFTAYVIRNPALFNGLQGAQLQLLIDRAVIGKLQKHFGDMLTPAPQADFGVYNLINRFILYVTQSFDRHHIAPRHFVQLAPQVRLAFILRAFGEFLHLVRRYGRLDLIAHCLSTLYQAGCLTFSPLSHRFLAMCVRGMQMEGETTPQIKTRRPGCGC